MRGFYQRLLINWRAMVVFLYRHGLVILIALLAFTADQFSKLGIEFYLPLGSSWPEEGLFRFTHVANTGSAFGLFGGQNLTLTIASAIGIVVLILFYRSQGTPGIWVQTSLGLMFAGAFGNLADRIRLGHVTDFIDVGPWYIFNIADASIVTGIIIFGAVLLLTKPITRPALVTTSIPGDEEYAD